MWNALHKGATLWTVGGAIVVIASLVYTFPEKLQSLPSPLSEVFIPTLEISGTAVNVEIEAGTDNSYYRGGNVDSTGASVKIYVHPAQSLNINVSGTGASVAIDKRIAPNVSITNSGTGAEVYEY